MEVYNSVFYLFAKVIAFPPLTILTFFSQLQVYVNFLSCNSEKKSYKLITERKSELWEKKLKFYLFIYSIA